MNLKNGFTLIELMIVVVMIAVLAAIAYPSYQQYILRSNASLAEAEMQRIAQDLERYKSRNFSYRLYTPISINVGDPLKYTITVQATATTNLATDGSAWVMKAVPQDVKNFTYLFNNQGLRCKNKVASKVTFTDCGAIADGSEDW
ncbi:MULTISPECIES: type IV pilin protein [Acinetobacter]|uniref:Prepilin-type N-terminal cleavage/methylation domain-containing protein n=1 Tax=Acinetobacter piscicola TaxID=2006115 RepID=A0A7S7AIY7_9GAMM|nr:MULTISPECIES: type IV pilin protein [Acinetobacter]QOW47464.1 prepilin-type N-terminal cleavage/methylation domain-containing protein [Acinetobacter piscicola]